MLRSAALISRWGLLQTAIATWTTATIGGILREHASNPVEFITLRMRCDYFISVCGAEAGIATAKGVLESIVQHRCSHVEEGLRRRPVPAHLLLLVHAPGEELVDVHRTLHERGRDRFAIPAPDGAKVIDAW